MSHYAEQVEAQMEALAAENVEIAQHEASARWRLAKRISCLESQVEQLTDRMNSLLSINNAEVEIRGWIERVSEWS